MSANRFGSKFTITVVGESHGDLIGVVVDGFPPRKIIDMDSIQTELNRRKPGQSKITTQRKEDDTVEIKSGYIEKVDQTTNSKEKISTGAPILMIIKNGDQDSSKYEQFKVLPRPGHMDYAAIMKYGEAVDLRGSGRFSGRLTACFVMAGALAKQLLSEKGIKIVAYTKQIGTICDNETYSVNEILQTSEKTLTRTVKPEIDEQMVKEIESAKKDDDSVGGIIRCIIENVPVGTGCPMFHSIESDLASGMFSIPAIKGIEFGAGFQSAFMRGSQHNDPYSVVNGKVITETNNNGGITGGLATGMPIVFNVVVKPTASIGRTQNTVNLKTMQNDTLTVVGRHDPCIVPRAVPVVEAMTAIVLINYLL